MDPMDVDLDVLREWARNLGRLEPLSVPPTPGNLPAELRDRHDQSFQALAEAVDTLSRRTDRLRESVTGAISRYEAADADVRRSFGDVDV
jgi:hypothetical protein